MISQRGVGWSGMTFCVSNMTANRRASPCAEAGEHLSHVTAVDSAGLNFGNGLLLRLDAAIREVPDGALLEVRGGDPSVVEDLAAWCEITGNALVGPSLVRKGAADLGDEVSTPLGKRLWLYTNFDCNLSCDYCCARSSPAAPARRMPLDLAVRAGEEFVALGGEELYLTGGEPFLNPALGSIVQALTAHLPLTILTNAMVFARGSRRAVLESLNRDRVTLQISLDSAGPALHDRHRGPGSHARALDGIELARRLGFPVKVAATIDAADSSEEPALLRRLDAANISTGDRLIRRVALTGSAMQGIAIGRDDLYPEPTLTVDGAWWHPVGIGDPAMRVNARPLPLAHTFTSIADELEVRSRGREAIRSAFRCA